MAGASGEKAQRVLCDWDGVNERVQAERAELLAITARDAFERREITLTSGRTSNYYIDGKQVTLRPRGAYLFAKIILEALRGQPVDAIGGPTLGADPIVGAVVALSEAEGRPIPGFIVRKEPKKHGTRSLIEGNLGPGARVVILEDVITTGGSILRAIEAAEGCGAQVVGVIVLTDRQEGGKADLEARGYPCYAVFTAKELAEAK